MARATGVGATPTVVLARPTLRRTTLRRTTLGRSTLAVLLTRAIARPARATERGLGTVHGRSAVADALTRSRRRGATRAVATRRRPWTATTTGRRDRSAGSRMDTARWPARRREPSPITGRPTGTDRRSATRRVAATGHPRLGPRTTQAATQDRLGPDASGRARSPGSTSRRDRRAEDALDLAQQLVLVDAHQRDGVARRAGAARPADAVDVVLGHHRQLVVDDVRQRVDVEPARGDLGRDEDRRAAGLEVGERADPLAPGSCCRGSRRPRCRRARAAGRAGWRRAWCA